MKNDYELQRHHTKAGPGRMPFNRTQGISGAKLWHGLTERKPDTWLVDGVWAPPAAYVKQRKPRYARWMGNRRWRQP